MLLSLSSKLLSQKQNNTTVEEKPFLQFNHKTVRLTNDTVNEETVKRVFPLLAKNRRSQENAIAALNLASVFIYIEETTGVPVSVCLAHWAMETGWGSSARYINDRNFGGIIWRKGRPSWNNTQDAIDYWAKVLTQPNYTKYFTDSMTYNDYLRAYALGNYYGSSQEERDFANKNRRIVIENLIHNTYYLEYCEQIKSRMNPLKFRYIYKEENQPLLTFKGTASTFKSNDKKPNIKDVTKTTKDIIHFNKDIRAVDIIDLFKITAEKAVKYISDNKEFIELVKQAILDKIKIDRSYVETYIILRTSYDLIVDLYYNINNLVINYNKDLAHDKHRKEIARFVAQILNGEK